MLPPVILTSEGLPQDGTGCESWRPEDYPVDDDLIWRVLFHDDVASIGRVCDGDTVGPSFLYSAFNTRESM